MHTRDMIETIAERVTDKLFEQPRWTLVLWFDGASFKTKQLHEFAVRNAHMIVGVYNAKARPIDVIEDIRFFLQDRATQAQFIPI